MIEFLRSAEEIINRDFMRFLIRLMTRNEFYVKGELKKERVSIIEGMPMGNFLNNIYLGDLDQILEPEAVCYMRYADDIAFFTDSLEKANFALAVIKEQCSRLKLFLNEKRKNETAHWLWHF